MPCASVVLALAGCGGGGGGGDPTAAIRQAVKSSPLSYFHYTAATWWGRPVSVGMTVTSAPPGPGDRGVTVHSGGKTSRPRRSCS